MIMPCWWMPAAWAKALAPTMALLGAGEADALGEHLAGAKSWFMTMLLR